MKLDQQDTGSCVPFPGISTFHFNQVTCHAGGEEEAAAGVKQNIPSTTVSYRTSDGGFTSHSPSRQQVPPSSAQSWTSQVMHSTGTWQSKYHLHDPGFQVDYHHSPFASSMDAKSTPFKTNLNIRQTIQSMGIHDNVSRISGHSGNCQPTFTSRDVFQLQLRREEGGGGILPEIKSQDASLVRLTSSSHVNGNGTGSDDHVSPVCSIGCKYLPAAPPPLPPSLHHSTCSASNPGASRLKDLPGKEDKESPKSIIKSSVKNISKSVPKSVQFSGSDLVHVTEDLASSDTTTINQLFPRYHDPMTEIPEQEDVDFGGLDLLQDNPEFWFESSTTDPEPRFFPSPRGGPEPLPLSSLNDAFGRTTIFVTSGTFRPSDSGKLNGKSVEDLGGPRGNRRTLSTGTLNGIQSHRTRVRIDFSQGVLDINHNPGQTAEVDSKATQDSPGTVSSYNYRSAILKDAPKCIGVKEKPKKSSLVKEKICEKLSHYRRRLILVSLLTLTIICLTIGLALGLRH